MLRQTALAPSVPLTLDALSQIPPDPDGIIDMEVFSQIREMDEDEDDEPGAGAHEFSKGIVWGFFDQAENTFKDMEDAM